MENKTAPSSPVGSWVTSTALLVPLITTCKVQLQLPCRTVPTGLLLFPVAFHKT